MIQDECFTRIKVMGFGKYGIDKIDYLVKNKIKFVEYIAIDEENQDLKNSEEIKKYLKGLDVLFIINEMDNSLEEHLSLKISKIAKNMGILTIALTSINSTNWTSKEYSKIEKLKEYADALIISDDKCLKQSFENSDSFFKIAVRGIANLITSSQLVGLDYADIKNILLNSGIAAIGFGEAEGENRVLEATQQALDNLSLQKYIDEMGNILLNITASEELSLNETFAAASHVRKEINKKNEDDTDILFSTVESNSLGKKINITIIAIEK